MELTPLQMTYKKPLVDVGAPEVISRDGGPFFFAVQKYKEFLIRFLARIWALKLAPI